VPLLTDAAPASQRPRRSRHCHLHPDRLPRGTRLRWLSRVPLDAWYRHRNSRRWMLLLRDYASTSLLTAGSGCRWVDPFT